MPMQVERREREREIERSEYRRKFTINTYYSIAV